MSPLSDAERFARLRLARTDQVGPVAFSQLLQRFSTAIRATEALPDLIRRGGRDYALPAVERVEAVLAAGERVGAQLILFGDSAYPALLAAVDPPPPLLWTRGDPALLSRPCIGIVGARIASAGGQRIARGLAQQLGEAGHVVVSGLARGVDAATHLGAVPTGTVAVLGGGVDDVYPAENADLYRQIVEQGCIGSESPVGARAQARDFPRRNRIISGLSRGVIVVEAEIRSGSLIMTDWSMNRGATSSPSQARPWTRARKVPTNCCVRAPSCARGWRTWSVPSTPCGPCASRPVIRPSRVPDDLDEAVIEQVTALLSPTPTPRDELARALDLPIGVVASALPELSLAGRASLLPGVWSRSRVPAPHASPDQQPYSGPTPIVRRRPQRAMVASSAAIAATYSRTG